MSGSAEGRRIVAFYEGSSPDDRGRFLDDVLRFDDGRLESVHDFIQWLFPLPERSGANPTAPVLDAAAINEFRSRPELRAALRRSLDRMLAFYGFAWDGARVVTSASFPGCSGWLSPGNHNHLRLTRILRSLTVLGELQATRALFQALSDVCHDKRRSGPTPISERTFRFWSDALAL
jgi:hypothetical protein